MSDNHKFDISRATINLGTLWTFVIVLGGAMLWGFNNIAFSSDIQALEKTIERSDKKDTMRYFMIQKQQLELMKIMTSDVSDADQIQKDIQEIDRKILCLRTDGCVLIDDV